MKTFIEGWLTDEYRTLIQPLLENILQFHDDLEETDIPVSKGVRDIALLESAINEPFKTFGGEYFWYQ